MVWSRFTLSRCLLFCVILFYRQSMAITYDIDPKIGVEVTMSSVQGLMSAPPVPRIDGGKSIEFQVGVNYLSATSFEPDPVNSPGIDKGKFDGYSYTLGVTSKEENGYRYFSWLMGNSVSGSINLTGTSSNATLSDLSAKSNALTIGLSKRLLGDAKSVLNFGIFGGATFVYFSSSFVVPIQGGTTTPFSVAQNEYGPLVGAQMNIRMGNFLLNPYALFFDSLASGCLNLGGAPLCEEISATFSAMGVNVGYAGLLFTAYSTILNSQGFSGVQAHNYGLSYTFGLE
jgi:hypothetical protein